ncbi:MAG: 3-deoxy-D-manno-octulosonic acid transferase, partial [Methylovulum sp.]
DTIGELKMLYAASDVTFVGGSLVPKGGHNILEAAAVGVPVLFGPYMINFKEIAEEILKQDAAIQCHGKDDIIAALIALHDNPDYSSRLVEKGKLFVQRNQGAIDRICEVLSHDIA